MDPTIRKYYAIHGLPSPDAIVDIIPRLQLDLERDDFDQFFSDFMTQRSAAMASSAPASSSPQTPRHYRQHRRTHATSTIIPFQKALPPTPTGPRRRPVVRFAAPEPIPEQQQPRTLVPASRPAPAASSQLVDESLLMDLCDADEADALPVELTESPQSAAATATATDNSPAHARRHSTASSSFSVDSVDTTLLFEDTPELVDHCDEVEGSLASTSYPSTPSNCDFAAAVHAMKSSASRVQKLPPPSPVKLAPVSDHKNKLTWAWLEACP